MLQIVILDMSFKIASLKLQPPLPRYNEAHGISNLGHQEQSSMKVLSKYKTFIQGNAFENLFTKMAAIFCLGLNV